MKLETPKYNLDGFQNVYDPREDTFLLLDAIELEIPYLQQLRPTCAVEIGSGSGVIIASLKTFLKTTCSYFATDINFEACEATFNTSQLNMANVNVINMNLLDNFKVNMFDVVLFNPPYVVTESDEIEGFSLSRAWAGGNQGRQVTDEIIYRLPTILSQNGVCYLVLLKDNNLDEIRELFSSMGFKNEIVIQRKIIGEHLYVMKVYRV